jgi:cytochrome c-type biogenesis protein CcmH
MIFWLNNKRLRCFFKRLRNCSPLLFTLGILRSSIFWGKAMGFSKTFLLLVGVVFSSLSAFAAIETHDFANELERKRYQSFIEEMRCPKCQNQNLAGSDSAISIDLRNKLYEMIKLDKSDKEITDFMVERYGDYILYRPRVTPATYVLWGAPIALLVIGIVVVILILQRRRRLAIAQVSQHLTDEEQTRLNSLLNSADKMNDATKNTDNNTRKDEEPRS